ncbi:Mov34/MPN/PAD-1 family protein [Aurantiacibacter marinus]|uniref:Peptidase n=1 Tax=Aurantiacibacter marinus TaxID=874156 RepID=A0A0H0XP08_9SPHN|nr:M67 family metallopeptidase [Aurantiacibacter marinus]KLI64293.1 peptidase [Aurantiacibacter marinus]
MAVEVSIAVLDTLRAEAVHAHPCECCGILTGKGDCITAALPAPNIHSFPETHFEIDPGALITAHRNARKGAEQVLGYYHSHPQGPAHPSETDRALSARDNAVWAIIAPDKITWWRDTADGFSPLPYSVTSG